MKGHSAIVILVGVLLLGTAAMGFDKEPITGEAYTSWLAAQDEPLQAALEEVFPPSKGYFVTGPLDPLLVDIPHDIQPIYHSVRVICPDFATFAASYNHLVESGAFPIVDKRRHITKAMKKELVGYRGILVTVDFDGRRVTVQMQTTNQIRWLVWAQRFLGNKTLKVHRPSLARYAAEVGDYLYAVDTGAVNAMAPSAADHNLPPELDIYAEPPDYVIAGYQNYLDFLYTYRPIYTEFASGIEAFIPSDSLMAVIVAAAPETAWPNKEHEMLQEEYREFYLRGGSVTVMATLTPAGYDTLSAGEYFFAVGLTGEIRFGRELLREEVIRIEQETGSKVARANHAFLFPGEPVLAAGAFFIEGSGEERHLAHVTAQSGHYFYSNITSTIREDISNRSDDYLLTLGHFFEELDQLGVPYQRVLLSKF